MHRDPSSLGTLHIFQIRTKYLGFQFSRLLRTAACSCSLPLRSWHFAIHSFSWSFGKIWHRLPRWSVNTLSWMRCSSLDPQILICKAFLTPGFSLLLNPYYSIPPQLISSHAPSSLAVALSIEWICWVKYNPQSSSMPAFNDQFYSCIQKSKPCAPPLLRLTGPCQITSLSALLSTAWSHHSACGIVETRLNY